MPEAFELGGERCGNRGLVLAGVGEEDVALIPSGNLDRGLGAGRGGGRIGGDLVELAGAQAASWRIVLRACSNRSPTPTATISVASSSAGIASGLRPGEVFQRGILSNLTWLEAISRPSNARVSPLTSAESASFSSIRSRSSSARLRLDSVVTV